MLMPHFIVIPPTKTVCGSCASWEGARILQDGNYHSLSEAFGYCRNIPDEKNGYICNLPILPIKKAPETACEAWRSAQ